MIWPDSSAIGMNWRRHQHALLRVLPAHQRLDAEQFRRLEVDDRLELEEEFVPRQRLRQVVLEAEPLVELLLHARVEHDVAAFARGFRVVHRDVGVAQQVLGVVVGPRAGATPMLA